MILTIRLQKLCDFSSVVTWSTATKDRLFDAVLSMKNVWIGHNFRTLNF